MNQALDAFMATLIDYAGLFPPAALDVPSAVAEFARHRAEPEAWMLGRFIAPAARLAEIGTAASGHLSTEAPWGFSVLVGDRESADLALRNLSTQASQIATFEMEYLGRARVECLETPIPPDGAEQPTEFVPSLLLALRELELDQREIYLEINPDHNPRPVLAAIAAAGSAQASGPDAPGRVGAKLRCGGVTADAFPSCEQVATVIQECAKLDLPLKCTAGLHHPVRHLAQEPKVMMHGFLNVFAAGLLAWAVKPGFDELVKCVAEIDAGAFAFSGTTFAWRDHRVDVQDMNRIRRRYLSGFGSCSFVEPRSDLQALGIL